MKAASHVRADEALVQGKESTITGVDPATIARFYTFDWTDGSDAHARAARRPTARSSPRRYAEDQHLKVGSRLSIETPSGDKRTLVVRGIYDPPRDRTSCSATSASTQQAFDKAFPQPEEQVHVPRRRRRTPTRR